MTAGFALELPRGSLCGRTDAPTAVSCWCPLVSLSFINDWGFAPQDRICSEPPALPTHHRGTQQPGVYLLPWKSVLRKKKPKHLISWVFVCWVTVHSKQHTKKKTNKHIYIYTYTYKISKLKLQLHSKLNFSNPRG